MPCISYYRWKQLPHELGAGGEQLSKVLLKDFRVFQGQKFQYNNHSQQFEEAR